jgi:hypothetical protein
MTKIMVRRHDMAIWYDVIIDTCGLRDSIRGSMASQLDILFIYYSINQYLSHAIGIVGKHRRSLISKVGTSSNSSFNLKFITPSCGFRSTANILFIQRSIFILRLLLHMNSGDWRLETRDQCRRSRGIGQAMFLNIPINPRI